MTDHGRQAALERACQGDLKAWGQLLDSFRPYVRVLVRGTNPVRLQQRVADSDLIQDSMLEAHRSFAEFRGATIAELLAWLRVIVLRTVKNVKRLHSAAKREIAREQQGIDLHGILGTTDSSPSAQAIRHEEAALIAEALDGLPDDMQQVLLGRSQDDTSYAVLAERLGRSEVAVRVLYTRALRRLREVIMRSR